MRATTEAAFQAARPDTAAPADAGLLTLPRGLALEWPGGHLGPRDAKVRLTLSGPRDLVMLTRRDMGALADAHVRGDIGIEGSWRDVTEIVAELAGDPIHDRHPGEVLTRWWRRLQSHWMHRLSRDASNIRHHYDVGDRFYALWLDPRRVYSCAYYADDSMTLAQAQAAKLDLVCMKLQLEPGQRLLDVGAGWGALAFWAARHYRVRVLGITLSRRQYEYMSRQIDAQGLAGAVSVRLADYRTLAAEVGRSPAHAFDRIASVGMFEHVGRSRLNQYFGCLNTLLRPGGLVLNHGIAAVGVDDRSVGRGMGDFIARHIFPGGELVHVSRALRGLSQAGLEVLDVENLRPHYARTLWAWSDALERQLDAAQVVAPAETVRAFRLYLAGSAMCFEHNWLALYQVLATRPDGQLDGHAMRGAQSDYPFRRSHMLAAAAACPHPVSQA